MSRTDPSLRAGKGAAERAAAEPASHEGSGKTAEDIGIAVLALSKRAHAAGLTTIAYLLESVALEAAACQRPADISGR